MTSVDIGSPEGDKSVVSVAFGSKYICALPHGYDERSRIRQLTEHTLIITHPEHPPLTVNTQTRELKKIEPIDVLDIPRFLRRSDD